MSAAAPRSLLARAFGACLLRADVYEEVEADRGATGQAFAVVVVSSVAAGIGSLRNGGWDGVLWFTLFALLGWWAWAWVTTWIGTRLLPGVDTEADVGELLRTIGFSTAPGVLRILGLQAELAAPVFVLTTLWMLVAMVVAVRQALDYGTTLRAVAVCALGFPVYAVTLVVTLLWTGPWPI